MLLDLSHKGGTPGASAVMRGVTVVVVGGAVLSGCASASDNEPDPAPPAAVSEGDTDPSAEAAPTEDSETSSFDLCAEFPQMETSGHGDLEGWWSSTPANADGSVIEDPADWPEPKMVEHPRTAVIDVESGEVLSTWDRTTCTDAPAFVPAPNEQWPAVTDDKREFVVVDMDSNEVVNTTIAPE
jgi:hypothetical protein